MTSKEPAELLGSIVAFEGRPDSISTQLRLLPTSPQVLILPSVQCQLPLGDLEHDFDARVYVRRVHDALVARNDTARTFLQGSTPTNKRLVFMNGGTPSAQALCIKAIMKHETAGDEAEAGAMFDDLIRDGLAGLDAQPRHKTSTFVTQEHHVGLDDPITRAMRAADALDRQTANLQPSDDLDLTVATRQRSSSLPLYGYSDAFGDAAPFFVFGARPAADRESQIDEGLVSPKTLTSPAPFDESAQKPTHLGAATPAAGPSSPSCIGESYKPMTSSVVPDRTEPEPEPPSPTSEVVSIRTLDNVVYGEASLLDVRHSIVARRGSLLKVRSLDRIFPTSSKYRDLCIPSESWLAEPETPRALRPQSLMVVMDAQGATLNRLHSIDQPRTVMVKSKLPIVRVAPVPHGKKKRKRNKRDARAKSTYVDRGTGPDADPAPKPSFQPVFSCTEDLVVFLKEGCPDRVLESAINAFKEGRYPLPPRAAEPASGLRSPLPGTPTSPSPESPRDFAAVPEESPSVSSSARADDYDPFAYIQPNSSQPRKSSQMSSTANMARPPTPAQTPPPSVAVMDNEHKFHEFTIAPNQTAVAVQNSLRSILAEYFPPDTQGYHQFQFSLLPEFDGLWKPIFRATEPDSPQKGDGKVHQILAIGSQTGVKKEYSLAITGQLERLGSKSSDLGRADRVDFRYLLANAMQAFTAQPLANQTSDNPFTNSYLLATLIVPHLETYLALHSEVRYLLLQYPPEHLGTVLALQKLVGLDLMKVAQIVDSNSKEQLPFTHIRGASIGSKSETTSGKRSSPSPRSSSDVPVSKANFLLTSTASDRDIATFVSTVWNIPPAELGDPDTLEPLAQRKGKPSPLVVRNDGLSAFPKMGAHSPVSPKTTMPSPHPMADAASSGMRPASMVESILTTRSRRTQNNRLQGNAQPPSDAASVVTFDPADDSEFDQEERRLMPLFLRRGRLRKPNSRKALKFLGLA